MQNVKIHQRFDLDNIISLGLNNNNDFKYLKNKIKDHNENFTDFKTQCLVEKIHKMLILISHHTDFDAQQLMLKNFRKWVDKGKKQNQKQIQDQKQILENKKRPQTGTSGYIGNSQKIHFLLKDYKNKSRTIHQESSSPDIKLMSYNSRQLQTQNSIIVEQMDQNKYQQFLQDSQKCSKKQQKSVQKQVKKKKKNIQMVPDYKAFSNSQNKQQDNDLIDSYFDNLLFKNRVQSQIQQDKEDIEKLQYFNKINKFKSYSITQNKTLKNVKSEKTIKSPEDKHYKPKKIQNFVGRNMENKIIQQKIEKSQQNLKKITQNTQILFLNQKSGNRPFSAIADISQIQKSQDKSKNQINQIKAKLSYHNVFTQKQTISKGIRLPDYEEKDDITSKNIIFNNKLIQNPFIV